MIELPGSSQDWLDAIDGPAGVRVKGMIAGGLTPEEVLDAWFNSNRPANIAHMGGGLNTPSFKEAFLRELSALICSDDAKYKNLRGQLAKGNRITPGIACGLLTHALSAELGYAAAFVGPAIAVAIMVILNTGKEAWCKTHASPSS